MGLRGNEGFVFKCSRDMLTRGVSLENCVRVYVCVCVCVCVCVGVCVCLCIHVSYCNERTTTQAVYI